MGLQLLVTVMPCTALHNVYKQTCVHSEENLQQQVLVNKNL